MEIFGTISDILWSYVMVALLLGCALWFTIRSKFVQVRMLRETFRAICEPVRGSRKSSSDKRHSISSFQAFTLSLASRVGIGNLAGVATAITLGGPGAVFWMWVIALFGAATSFVECTLAQLYKIKGQNSFIGGPAYYMWKGLGKRWMGMAFAILIILTFALSNSSLQCNTICDAMYKAFGWDSLPVGIVLTSITLIIIFGGVQRIAKLNSWLVPFMAICYILIAFFCVITNAGHLPHMFRVIIDNAFGWEQATGGGVAAAMVNGIKRGLFSNEAGEGSTPNAAATADVSHPVKQGLIQSLGVFVDTLVICSCTAFIILLGGVDINSGETGIILTQSALSNMIGGWGTPFVAGAIFIFAYTSILGNYYFGEANLYFITRKKTPLLIYRVCVGGMLIFGALTTLTVAWTIVDICMACMTFLNLVAVVLLCKQSFRLLADYEHQKRGGISSPVFRKSQMTDIPGKVECWED